MAGGTAWLPHSAPWRPASIVQRAVVHGIVVVVDDDVTGRVVVETAAIVVVVEGAFVVDVLELVDVVVG